jgi:anti-sigma factor RsiW
MTCREFENLLHPFVDDEFDAAERAAVDSHLASCPTCSARVHAERHFRHALREAVAGHPEHGHAPESLRFRILDTMRRERRRRSARRVMMASSVALALAAAASIGYASMPKRRDRFMLDAARRHARPFPVEIQARAHEEVEAWFRDKLDHRVSVPRFLNVEVAGARISNVQERPAAYIRYQKASPNGPSRDIGLFVFTDQDHEVEAYPLPSVQVDNRLGFNVAIWREGEIVYEMVTDLDERDILALFEAQQGSKPTLPPATAPPVDVRPASLDR